MIWTIGIFLSVLLQYSNVAAQALRFQPQGASATGQGNAFVAQADDPSAIHYNPAGLTQVSGLQAYMGTALVGGSIHFTGPTGATTRGDLGGSVAFPPPSHFYMSANLGALGLTGLSAVTAGIAVTSPFGLNTRYPTDGPFNTAVTSATLPLIDIKPAVAYKVTDSLSIGLNADIYTFASFLGEGQAQQQQVSAGTGGIPAGASLEFFGNGTGAGFAASLLYAPMKSAEGLPVLSIGFTYHSQAVLPLNGALLVNGTKAADASTSLVLPQIFSGGLALWPIRTVEREWKLEVDVEYVGWKSARNLDIRLSNGVTVPQPQQWKNVPVVAVGTEYKWLSPEWLHHWEVAARGGYTRTQDPVPDQTFNPATISLTANTISVGGGMLCREGGRFLSVIPCGGESWLLPKAIGVDVAYQAWIYESRTVTGNINPTVNGDYRVSVQVGIVSLRFVY
ncbi:putative long-chain fatty acid outer membrane transporter [Nitrospira japonica]|uniref:Putative long-chain fatty acid outer membrane transporter n=1 Tax=Nitrospira japonica TaxID=1325564 RepID=A0A1W1I458_9BACT|nr:outer membrane protein transport protein [Nitrospira japonica]SLM47784.1 putative long-chain fatty acid outer membrane transporter [Nitrospira japonica]